jgi:hypothetical protein
MYNLQEERFTSFSLHHDTASVRAGSIVPYGGELPCGIQWTDSCVEIERKLAVESTKGEWIPGCTGSSCDAQSRAASYWKYYEVGPHRYTLIFDSEDGGLGMFSLDLRGASEEL